MKKKIVIAHGYTSIEIFHSILPFVLTSKKTDIYNFNFVNYKTQNLFNVEGDLLVLIRKYHDGKTTNENIISELKDLRKNFSKIVYFDDSAASSVIFFCAFPYLDQYWKRSVLKDKELYKQKLYGGHLFSDYYYRKFNLNDENKNFINPLAESNTQFSKLKISWNIGVGIYPTNHSTFTDRNYIGMRKFITALSLISGVSSLSYFFEKKINLIVKQLDQQNLIRDKILKVSARFSDLSYRNSVGYQRRMCIELTKNKDFFLSGYLKKTDFTKETFHIFGVLSPFGWGEVCYRDFEAVIAGAYLIKPDMSHIETWPNIFTNNYHPLDWSLSEISRLDYLLNDIENIEIKINNTRKYYSDSLNNIVPRCLEMIGSLF